MPGRPGWACTGRANSRKRIPPRTAGLPTRRRRSRAVRPCGSSRAAGARFGSSGSPRRRWDARARRRSSRRSRPVPSRSTRRRIPREGRAVRAAASASGRSEGRRRRRAPGLRGSSRPRRPRASRSKRRPLRRRSRPRARTGSGATGRRRGRRSPRRAAPLCRRCRRPRPRRSCGGRSRRRSRPSGRGSAPSRSCATTDVAAEAPRGGHRRDRERAATARTTHADRYVRACRSIAEPPVAATSMMCGDGRRRWGLSTRCRGSRGGSRTTCSVM